MEVETEKNNLIIGECTIIFDGKKRYYIEDLTQRDFNLECVTPHFLKIDNYVIEENAWGELIRKLVLFLISKSSKSKDEIISFKVQWSKTDIFSTFKKNKL